ncbi:Uncharacterized protein SCF082_LOCUS21097 [Durusdinium trenchii]|uniref:Protein kinase domain-containing protein n=1 Tax=Durusdinium trenchii TaxID=1381693 RepID=A0ABP0L723_9DINO
MYRVEERTAQDTLESLVHTRVSSTIDKNDDVFAQIKSFQSHFSAITRTPHMLRLTLQMEFNFVGVVDVTDHRAEVDKRTMLASEWFDSTFVVADFGAAETWAIKIHDEVQLGKTVVALLPARTSQKWFHDLVLNAAQDVRFVQGHVYPNNANPQSPKAMAPSCIAIYRGYIPKRPRDSRSRVGFLSLETSCTTSDKAFDEAYIRPRTARQSAPGLHYAERPKVGAEWSSTDGLFTEPERATFRSRNADTFRTLVSQARHSVKDDISQPHDYELLLPTTSIRRAPTVFDKRSVPGIEDALVSHLHSEPMERRLQLRAELQAHARLNSPYAHVPTLADELVAREYLPREGLALINGLLLGPFGLDRIYMGMPLTGLLKLLLFVLSLLVAAYSKEAGIGLFIAWLVFAAVDYAWAFLMLAVGTRSAPFYTKWCPGHWAINEEDCSTRQCRVLASQSVERARAIALILSPLPVVLGVLLYNDTFKFTPLSDVSHEFLSTEQQRFLDDNPHLDPADTIFISFAHNCCHAAHEKLTESVKKSGMTHFKYDLESARPILPDYVLHRILTQPIGAGLWSWKPHLIRHHLNNSPEGTVVVYGDTSLRALAPGHLIAHETKKRGGAMFFDVGPLSLNNVVKTDLLLATGIDPKAFSRSMGKEQSIIACFMALENNKRNRAMIDAWAALMQDQRLFDASRSRGGPEHPKALINLYDQGVISLLARHNYPGNDNPAYLPMPLRAPNSLFSIDNAQRNSVTNPKYFFKYRGEALQLQGRKIINLLKIGGRGSYQTIPRKDFQFKDIRPLQSVIVIGTKKDESGKPTKAAAMYDLIKYVHRASVHMHVDPVPEDGKPPKESDFEALKKTFDYAMIYPECERIVFERALTMIGIPDPNAKIDAFRASAPDLPMVVCLNRFKPGAKIEVKAMKRKYGERCTSGKRETAAMRRAVRRGKQEQGGEDQGDEVLTGEAVRRMDPRERTAAAMQENEKRRRMYTAEEMETLQAQLAAARAESAAARAESAAKDKELTASRSETAAVLERLRQIEIPLGEALGLPLLVRDEDAEFLQLIEATNNSVTVKGVLPGLTSSRKFMVKSLVPANVVLWSTFATDMDLARFLGDHSTMVNKGKFVGQPLKDFGNSSESFALDVLKKTVVWPMRACKFNGREVQFVSEATDAERRRADMDWYFEGDHGLSKDNPEGRRRSGLFEAMSDAFSKKDKVKVKRVCLLRHEHKDPGKFPVSSLEERSYDLVEFWGEAVAKAQEVRAEAKSDMNLEDEEEDQQTYGELQKAYHVSLVSSTYPLCQILEYMMYSGMRFGVLSVTRATWFLRHNGDGILHVTEPYLYTGEGDKSTKLAYYAMLHHLMADPRRVHAPMLDTNTQWFKEVVRPRMSDKALKPLVQSLPARKPDQEFYFPCLVRLPFPDLGDDLVQIFSSGKHVHVERRLAHGHDVVIKKLMDEEVKEAVESFENEEQVLMRLRGLEGSAVPELYHAGLYFQEELIVTKYSGENMSQCFHGEQIPDWAAQGAVDALAEVHRAGVLHGDIALRNFVADTTTKQVRIIDFGFARISGDRHKQEKEMSTLLRLLRGQ